MLQLPFRNRSQAAQALAIALARYRGTRPLVLGIPPGGVPMARIVADALQGEMDLVQVCKLGAPGDPEFAIGAIDERGAILLHDEIVRDGIERDYVEKQARAQLALMRERRARYGAGTAVDPAARTVIVVDDGLATGATMMAALRAVRARHPARLVCAVPVAPPGSLIDLRHVADEVVCLSTPRPFYSVGLCYLDFSEVADDDVARALQPQARQPDAHAGHPAQIPTEDRPRGHPATPG